MRHTPRTIRHPIGTVAIAVIVTAAVSGCGGDDTAEPVAEAAAASGITAGADAAPDHGLVSPDQAAELATSGVTVIDVRTPEEFAQGHVDGARLIDFYSATFADQIAALDPDGEYLVYCRSGNRSGETVALMQQLGIERVWELDGGVVAAEGSGLTLVR